jgi:membrane-associated phospholipid phosphatase
MMLRSLVAVAGLACGALPLGAQAERDSTAAAPPGAFTWVEARRFAGVAALGAIAYLADDAARDALRERPSSATSLTDALSGLGYYYGDPGVAVLAVAMWGSGRLAHRPALAASGFRGMEAVAVSGVVVSVLKGIAGRARPEVSPHAKDDWRILRGFRGDESDYRAMASGHATVTFAFATAVTGEVARRAPRAARVVGVTTFGLAAVTSWQRMHADRHWLSDVTVGAGIGTVTALAIARWHATRPTNAIDRLFLGPTLMAAPDGSMAVGFSISPRRR